MIPSLIKPARTAAIWSSSSKMKLQERAKSVEELLSATEKTRGVDNGALPVLNIGEISALNLLGQS